ncbi:hypothetical protein FHX52_2078 [Humibacillus xanthopallidus]|uniref:Uncharacterized protein n=1 Tax=Humibacillus xanthopallidus TaxID=412689 RepID=A0A543PXW9_9MICO|nr:hypothetical protein FHX52_2078 [Humibacillus xanthopallidus]
MLRIIDDACQSEPIVEPRRHRTGVSLCETPQSEHAIRMTNLEQVLKIPAFNRDPVPG